MVDRIIALIKQKGLSVNAVEKQLGFGNGAIKRFGTSSPSVDKIIALSNFLNVSTDYLILGKEKNSSPSLSEDEHNLINCYNELTDKGKGRLLERAESLKEEYSFKSMPILKKIANSDYSIPLHTIKIKRSYYKVSAGLGYNLNDNDQWDYIDIPSTPEAQRADFCLTISGNSMEPIYYDGDIVLIKSQPVIEIGEIGIFIIESSGYIKKYGEDRLISLNAEYDDILFSDYNPEDIHCVGLVIGRV